MKTVGLLGGMSWESTMGYYKALNEGIRSKLGGFHSAKIVMFSVDFEPIEKLQRQGKWDDAALILSEAAKKIEAAGADFLLICTNTMHKVEPQISQAIKIPILHIADTTAEVLIKNGIKTVGLLGTNFTMEQDFYKGRLQEKHNIKVIVPDITDREIIHAIIYNELCLGKIQPNSKAEYLRIIKQLSRYGAEAIILGCTEINMLIKQSDTTTPLYDTTIIHVNKALEEIAT